MAYQNSDGRNPTSQNRSYRDLAYDNPRYDKRDWGLDEHYDRENKRTDGLFRNNGRARYPDDNSRHDFAGQHSYFPDHFDGQEYPYDTDQQFQSPSNWNGRQRFGIGPHAGKGPKNFRRSDERLLEEINERLTRDSHIDATDISVSVSNGIATLSGTVENKHAKRRAENIADSVSGVQDVMNELRTEPFS